MFMLWPGILEVNRALTNDVEVFTGVEDLFLMFSKENRYHLLPVGEAVLPILIIEVFFDVFFTLRFVFSHDEFIKGVFKYSLKNPLAQYLKVGLSTFLQ